MLIEFGVEKFPLFWQEKAQVGYGKQVFTEYFKIRMWFGHIEVTGAI